MLFLTPSELIELTERKRKSDQIAWLRANNFPFAVGANGHPRVFREYVYERLCGVGKMSVERKPEPKWSAI
jgi:Domain of unknown function (DUF4224)